MSTLSAELTRWVALCPRELMTHSYLYPRAANTASVIAWTNLDHGVQILGIIRGKDPYQGMLALPGGFHEVGKETLEHTAVRELREETSIDVHEDNMKLVCVQSQVSRDPREHVIDHVYAVEVPYDILQRAQAGDDASTVQVVNLQNSNYKWAFDHQDSINRFLSQLR